MTQNKIFLDTNVCNQIAYSNLDHEWHSICRYVLENYKYVISPLTFIEILVKIGRGDKSYFEKNRLALQVLMGTKRNRTFLEFPGNFLLKHVVGSVTPPQVRPQDFERWARVVLKARDKTELEHGTVKLWHPRLAYGLDFSIVDRQLQEGKDNHRRTLEEVRDGRKSSTSAIAWAAGLLDGLNIKRRKETCTKVSKALEAAYCFDEYLWKQAKNHSYDFKKHDSNWVDGQQLFYLCDKSVWFVTQDGAILRETKKSSQSARIVSFKKLRELADAKCKLA